MKKVVIAALVTASVAGAGFAVARNHGGMGGNDKPCMRADGMHKMKAHGIGTKKARPYSKQNL